jgi:hypothetical protein
MFPTRPLIDEARQKGWLVPLSLLRSEIGIFCSCSLVRIQEGFFEPAYSLGPALLRHADFGAIITTWRTERSLEKGTHLYSLVNDLSAGIPPGVAVQTYNRSIFAKRFGINLCLLGDPAFRVSRHEATPKLPVPQLDAFGANSTATNRRDNTIGSEIKLLRAAIGATSSGKLFDPIQGRALADALLPYEEFTVPIHEIPDGRFSTLDSALLDFLSAAPMPGPFLGRFMRTDPVNEESVCPWCNSPARSYRATFPEFGASARNVVLCPSCFDSCNLPDGWDISVALEQLPMGGVVSVFGAPEGSQILVSFRGLEITNDYGFVRLIVTDGSVSVRIPENLPLLPLYCHVLIIHNLQLGAVGFAFMSEQHSELNSERSLPGCTNIQEESMTATHLQAKDT